jgi:hypothetical protein
VLSEDRIEWCAAHAEPRASVLRQGEGHLMRLPIDLAPQDL